ncbi:MAG TPA: ABC transporter permease, partial [Bacteroidota bacterium]|nr:ABC transporter permease [Bacteroidota bacterium]
RIEWTTPPDSATYARLLSALDAQKDVKAYSRFVAGKALIVSKNVNRVVNIRSLESSKVTQVSGVNERIVLGELNLGNEKQNNIVIGMVLADRLGVVIGDTIALVSPAGAELSVMQMGLPFIRRYRIMGIYESNNKDYDSYYAFTSLESGQSLFNKPGQIDGIDIRCEQVDQTENVRASLSKKLGNQFQILSWYDLHKELYSVMKLERWGAYIVLCLIIAVASFNLLGSLTMTVIEKTRDIGIMKSMGATNDQVKRIFFYQGFFIGLAGIILGMMLGLVIVYCQYHYHWFPLDPTVYIISAIPVEVRMTDVFVIALAAILLCAIASRYPAKRAAKLNPVEAIRWE